MSVRCEQCGYESDGRYRFCGMCGAKLPAPPVPPPPAREPVAARAADEEPAPRVSGPSILGLADEPTSSVTYLLEDEVSESHWGRTLVLVLVLAAIGVAGWYWRGPLRSYVAARLAQQPASNQSEQGGSAGAPVSASPSEVAPEAANANPSSEKPKTGVGDASSTTPPNPGPTPPAAAGNAAPATQTSAPPAANVPAANPANSGVANESPNVTSAPATPVPAQTQPVPSSTANVPAETQPPSKEAEPTVAKPEGRIAQAAERAKSAAKNSAEAATDADRLEARGERYLYGTGVAANCGRALADLQSAAGLGSSKADSVLGTMYATGHCVSRDLPLAYRWFAKALHQDPGNTRLQSDLKVLWNQMTGDERQIALRQE